MKDVIACIHEVQRSLNMQVYLVGGSVRDRLLKRPPKDLDFVVRENVQIFAQGVAESLGGTFFTLDEKSQAYRVIDKNKNIIDFAKMKGSKIEEDLYERDFTINAMAYDMTRGWPMDEAQVLDPYGGKGDLKNKRIRELHSQTFSNDPIRMLRAVRFMTELGFTLDSYTIGIIRQQAGAIVQSPGERIANEFFAILEKENSHYYLNYLDEPLNLLEQLFPELEIMKDVGQCKYHVVDCWTHSVYTVKMIEDFIYSNGYFEPHIRRAYEEHTREHLGGSRSRLALIKLGALFHDVGKPSARRVDQGGRTRFRGHEITGAEILKGYAERLRLSTREKEILYRYVALHMIPLDLYKTNDVGGKALYGVFEKMGEETLDILLIALADIIATRILLNPEEEMGMFKIHVEYIVNNYLTRYRPIERINSIINGKEIMESLQLPQSIMVGNLMEAVKKAIYLGQIPPTKQGALDYIKKIYC